MHTQISDVVCNGSFVSSLFLSVLSPPPSFLPPTHTYTHTLSLSLSLSSLTTHHTVYAPPHATQCMIVTCIELMDARLSGASPKYPSKPSQQKSTLPSTPNKQSHLIPDTLPWAPEHVMLHNYLSTTPGHMTQQIQALYAGMETDWTSTSNKCWVIDQSLEVVPSFSASFTYPIYELWCSCSIKAYGQNMHITYISTLMYVYESSRVTIIVYTYTIMLSGVELSLSLSLCVCTGMRIMGIYDQLNLQEHYIIWLLIFKKILANGRPPPCPEALLMWELLKLDGFSGKEESAGWLD